MCSYTTDVADKPLRRRKPEFQTSLLEPGLRDLGSHYPCLLELAFILHMWAREAAQKPRPLNVSAFFNPKRFVQSPEVRSPQNNTLTQFDVKPYTALLALSKNTIAFSGSVLDFHVTVWEDDPAVASPTLSRILSSLQSTA